MDTTTKSDEEQQTKRKQSGEKSVKKIKRKKPADSTFTDDVEGNINYFSYIIFD